MTVKTHLTHLESTGLLRLAQTHPELEYLFRHALVKDAAYGSLLIADRKQLHLRVGEALERLDPERREEFCGLLAYHFAIAGEQKKAIEYARLAARQAQAIYAYEEAVQYLQTALALLEIGEQERIRLALLEELADIQGLLHQDTQAISLYQAALNLWSGLADADKIIAVRLHRKLIKTVLSMGWHADFDQVETMSQVAAESRAYLEAIVSLAAHEPPHLELVHVLNILAHEAGSRRFPPALDEAEGYALAAVAMAEPLDRPVELSIALGTLARVYYARGLLRECVSVSLRQLALSRNPRFTDLSERLNILRGTGFNLTHVGEYVQAIPYLQEAESLSRQIEAVTQQIAVLTVLSYCYFRLDRWDEVLQLDEKRRELEQRYTRERVGPICFEIALSAAIHALRGDFDQAKPLQDYAYDIMLNLGGLPENWGRYQLY